MNSATSPVRISTSVNPNALVASSAGLASLEATVGTLQFYLNNAATLETGRVYSLFLLGDGTVAPAPPPAPPTSRGILVPDR